MKRNNSLVSTKSKDKGSQPSPIRDIPKIAIGEYHLVVFPSTLQNLREYMMTVRCETPDRESDKYGPGKLKKNSKTKSEEESSAAIGVVAMKNSGKEAEMFGYFYWNNGEIWSIESENLEVTNLRGTSVFKGMNPWGNGDLVGVGACEVGRFLKLMFYKNGKLESHQAVNGGNVSLEGNKARDSENDEENKSTSTCVSEISSGGSGYALDCEGGGDDANDEDESENGNENVKEKLEWLPAVIISMHHDIVLDVTYDIFEFGA